MWTPLGPPCKHARPNAYNCLQLFSSDIHAAIAWLHAAVFFDKGLKALGRIQRKGGRQRWHLFVVLNAPDTLDEAFVESLEGTEDFTMVQYLNSYERVLLRRARAAGMEQGLKKGWKQGLQLAEREGSVTLLRTLLERKFGSLPEWADTRMAQADTATLQEWALKVLDATRLEDVF